MGSGIVQSPKDRRYMLWTVWLKAKESRRQGGLLHDPMAEQAVKRIDYKFEDEREKPLAGRWVLLRARQLDEWSRAFLSQHPDAVVLHLGCGLDTRVWRVDPGPGVSWFELDFPDVIELRGTLYPTRAGCTLVGASVSDAGWLESLPQGRPAWVVAEGLTYYLTPEVMANLLHRLRLHFPSGEIAFDASGPQSRKAKRKGKAERSNWHLRDLRECHLPAPGFELLARLRPADAEPFEHLPPPLRWLMMMKNHLTSLGQLNMVLVRYRFKGSSSASSHVE